MAMPFYESAPQPAASEEQKAADCNGKPVILAEPDMKTVSAQVGRVARQHRGLRVQRCAEEDPAGVRPIHAAFARRVRIAFLVAQLVMDPMRGNPEDGAALE